MTAKRTYPPNKTAHGGSLRNKRKGRGARPVSVRHSMHLVMRSSQATGAKSFVRFRKQIIKILDKFEAKYGVEVMTIANVGNHIHLHLKIGSRSAYKAFIRAVTSAIAMKVSGARKGVKLLKRFWDLRPYTRFVVGRQDFENVADYIGINQMEGMGFDRAYARLFVKEFRRRARRGSTA